MLAFIFLVLCTWCMMSFSVGQQFSSFSDVAKAIQDYENLTYCKLWIRDSRSVEAGRKRMSRYLSDTIKYYEITYCCIHGGKKFTARGEGKRSTSYVNRTLHII